MKKSITNFLMVLGFTVTLVGFLIEGLDSANGVTVLASLFSLPGLAIALAVCFVFAKNNTVKNVGYALAALVGVYGVILIANESMIVAAIGMILMLATAIAYLVVLALAFFGFVKGNAVNEKLTTDISALLGKYKEMEKDNVITDEEFAQLKNQALQTLGDKESATLEDLKKWKKLLDQKVITEEEFAGLKAKVFTK